MKEEYSRNHENDARRACGAERAAQQNAWLRGEQEAARHAATIIAGTRPAEEIRALPGAFPAGFPQNLPSVFEADLRFQSTRRRL
jgi:hypothetical protein